MKIISDLVEWQAIRRGTPANQTIGFVPTMGNLHRGHHSLCVESTQQNDVTVVSIFINPTQFNQREDYLHYPKTLEQDFTLLEEAGVDYCLLPNEEALYADGYAYQIHNLQSDELMEGKHRPGHFKGVLTVVMKLLQLVKPHDAYFGEKDFQQFQLIRDMTKAFFMDLTLHACPTVREPSGLAYSSRNYRLSPEERLLAERFATLFLQASSCEEARAAIEAANIAVEYLEEFEGRRFAAVRIGEIRLIDNYAIV